VTQQKGQVALDGGPPVAATVEVLEDVVSIVPEGGDPVSLGLSDIDDLFDDDYTLRLTDYAGKRYDLSMLGKAYGQVVAEARQARNDKLQHDLLLTGVKLADTYPGKLLGGAEPAAVEIRLFEDMLLVIPERARMFGVPFSFIEDVAWDESLYQTTVRADDGASYVFGQLAKRSEEFRDELKRLMAALAARTAKTLQGLLPNVEPGLVSRLARVMRDGRAVQQRVVDAIDPGIWPQLEDAVVGAEGLRESYEHLKAMSPPGWTALGVKAVKAEAGDDATPEPEPEPEPAPDGEAVAPDAPPSAAADHHMWFFAPLTQTGNAIAHEITSETGHATYLYRSPDPSEEGVAAAMSRINRAILSLNFRREPIYASEGDLQTPKFQKYLVALRLLDYLRFTREQFLGRAIHNASWAQQVDDAIAKV
jgi:hypothetical protein